MATLNHRHPYFDHFMTTLAGPAGCNFRWVSDSTQPSGRRWTWQCDGHNTVKARAIMEQMNATLLHNNPIDIEASLAYLADYGGNCDCKIIINVPIIATDSERMN